MAETVVAACAGLRGVEIEAARRRLLRLYPERGPVAAVELSGAALFLVGANAPSFDGRAQVTLTWGRPIGENGDATELEIAAALDDPDLAAQRLAGTFVLVRATEDAIRLVTSANVVRTLAMAKNGGRTAVATKGLAALALVERPVRLDRDVIPEFVLFDAVLGGDEILAGIETLEDAQVIDIAGERLTARSWWPVETRFVPGPAAGALRLRDELGTLAGRVARARETRLALTAGLDSTLVASCMVEGGPPPPIR